METNTMILIIVALLALEKIVRAVAPLTATTADDKALAAIDSARAWSLQQAPHIWAVIEQLAAIGAIPKAQKAAEFLLRLKAAYTAAVGKAIPEAALAEAQTVAAGLSADAKLPVQMASLPIGVGIEEIKPVNPQPAPVSR